MSTTNTRNQLHWEPGHPNEDVVAGAVQQLLTVGGTTVSPTKVGYIIMTTDRPGLETKFAAKGRKKSKPAVVLCPSVELVHRLAVTDDRILRLYEACYGQDILLGCILPWRQGAMEAFIAEDAGPLVHDERNTSCFVIRFGAPSEAIAHQLWEQHGTLSFASSANPTGQGNRGVLEGVGDTILDAVDLVIEGDEFVASQQPGVTAETRAEQGVMVSMVDEHGNLTDTPTLIRLGLDADRVKAQLTDTYPQGWLLRHGQYH